MSAPNDLPPPIAQEESTELPSQHTNGGATTNGSITNNFVNSKVSNSKQEKRKMMHSLQERETGYSYICKPFFGVIPSR